MFYKNFFLLYLDLKKSIKTNIFVVQKLSTFFLLYLGLKQSIQTNILYFVEQKLSNFIKVKIG